MEINRKLGLIGKNISYSFSEKYFTSKFKKLMLTDYSYSLYDCQTIDDVKKILLQSDILGLNVTIPYKEKVLPLLDELSEEAQQIGAINTILIKNGMAKGFNTDVIGFEKSLQVFKKKHHHSAIILGDGGAAKAVRFVFEKNNIPYIIVSRKTGVLFQKLTEKMVDEYKIIVQCTPVGTFPDVEACLEFPFNALSKDHLVMDLIYNPNETLFLKKAQYKGAQTINGLLMLEQQAEAAWKIWTSI
ncbi:MAG: shikimate dehydrogenase [Bacteroidetes bacterium]|nr:shikimate dehydrogenase [Bacteroidota bacterium]